MRSGKTKKVAGVLAVLLLLGTCSCGAENESALDPKEPVTITVWNYYNGNQLAAFDQLVEDFNETVGLEKGVVVLSVSLGDITTLADSLLDSVNEKVGAQDVPTLASIYSETAYILDQKNMLVDLDNYFTSEELDVYVPEFIEEGRFNTQNELLLFPISKSTEVFAVNETDWAAFEEATGVTMESIQTKEALVAAAETYYRWTDSLTPEVPEDGKALYGRDSLANYIYLGSYQLGHELFYIEDGELVTDLDRDTFRILWDNYYIPFINGYFGAYANFRSEDAKTGKIIAMTVSTSGMGYLPTQVTDEDDVTHDIRIRAMKVPKFADATRQMVVQQGASFGLLKSTEAQQQGAVEFLKWFTDPQRNMIFSLQSGYSPVTVEDNKVEVIQEAYDSGLVEAAEELELQALLISAEVFASETSYETKPFQGSKNVRTLLEDSMEEFARADRTAVLEAMAAGKSREEAVEYYSSDAYFDQWFEDICTQVEALTQ